MTQVNQLTLKYLDEQNIFNREDRFNVDIEATQEKFQELVARKIEERKGLSANSVKFSYHHKQDAASQQQYQQSQGSEAGQGNPISQDELRQILDEVKEEKQFWVVAE